MSDDTTLVLGATGNTGRRVAARLRLRHAPVRTASRSSPTPFDWFRPADWGQVLRDVTTAYVVPPSVPGPVHDFVARAEAAGVRRLVLLSGRGADDWGDSAFGLDMRSAEDAVRGSTLEWTILRASNFAQNFDGHPFRAPLAAGELALPAGAVPEPFIDLEDVADVAATVLSEPGRHAGRAYELTDATRADLGGGSRADLPGIRAAHRLPARIPGRVHRDAGPGGLERGRGPAPYRDVRAA
ncbi:SDR family oxidoreductase [Streptomyces sp. NPDC020571]|uniref:SDR family oxidoreductase n=1 Tax=Streptomyces sp. NPDC020571 TaxID=3365079 RepID=UPI0037B27383